MKWKDAIFASGIPLEMDAARILVSGGFSVNTDARYFWGGTDQHRDAAVDLHGRFAEPLPPCDARMEVLVNCVTRGPDAAWLFLPDPNPVGAALSGIGTPLRAVDQFSPWAMDAPADAPRAAFSTICAKGLEIDLRTGDENGTVFRNALSRLQNALPRLLNENVQSALTGPREENRPFFFCPILLTSAPLYVMTAGLTPSDIAAAAALEEVSDKTDHLVLSANYSPAFRDRCMSETAGLRALFRTNKAMEIERKKVEHAGSRSNLPFTIMEMLMDGEYACLNRFFTQFLICSADHFARLLDRLTASVHQILENARILR